MMQRVRFIWFIVLLSLGVMPLVASEAGTQGMARYMPEDVDIFIALRTDEAYLLTLEDAVNSAIVKLPPEAGLLPLDFIQLINADMERNDTSYEAIRIWLGDYVGIGMRGIFSEAAIQGGQPGEAFEIVVAIDINDARAFEDFLMSAPNAENLVAHGISADGFTIYRDDLEDVEFAIGADVVYMTTIDSRPDPGAPRLNDVPDYVANLNALPEDAYNIFFYMTTTALQDIVAMEDDEALDFLLDNFPASFSVGLTILEGRAFTIDFAQPVPGGLMDLGAINLDYATRIPQATQFLIWGHDLAGTFNVFLDQLSDISALEGSRQDLRMPLRAGLALAGIDLDEDMLAWMTGDYIVLGGIDLNAILDAIIADSPELLQANLPASFGLLFEATDEARARGLADKLGAFLMRTLDTALPPDAPEIRITQDAPGVWSLRIAVPLDFSSPPLVIDVGMGVDNGMFYLATRDVVDVIGGAGVSLAEDARYEYARRFFLPNTIALLYTDDDGIISSFGGLALLGFGFFVGDIFNLFGNLQISDMRMPIAQRDSMEQGADDVRMVRMLLDVARSIVHSTSITSTVTDEGYAVGRAVLILEP